ncbi:MAG TPA: thioredoxin domain-containing protein [Pyrinomonadaceae bacterium]|jgi:protein-disulfide isomerase|nr:thioredoxin domain-containing protein [Pyrinomonadaceae bacterium]
MSRKSPSPKSPSPTQGGKKSVLPFVIIGGVLVAVIAAVVLMSQRAPQDDPPPPQSNSNAAPTAAPRQVSPGVPDPYSRGGASAAVTLEEFSDFECPACGALEPGLRKVVNDYGARVRLIFRNFPLPMHRYALQAARAAEAAGQQGKFWEMHDALYDHQEEWSKAMEPRVQFDSYAARLGLDVQKFKSDMERTDLLERIKADVQRGNSLNVRGTPTVFLNGRELLPGKLVTEADLRREIDAALGGAAK